MNEQDAAPSTQDLISAAEATRELGISASTLYAYVMRRPELLWDPPTDRRRRIGGFLAVVPDFLSGKPVAPRKPRL